MLWNGRYFTYFFIDLYPSLSQKLQYLRVFMHFVYNPAGRCNMLSFWHFGHLSFLRETGRIDDKLFVLSCF